MKENKMDYVHLMTHGTQVPLQTHLMWLLPHTVMHDLDGPRTFYKVGSFDGYIAVWDEKRKVGFIRNDFRKYILEQKAKRSER